MKQILLLVFFLNGLCSAYSQGVHLTWAKQYGGPDNQMPFDIAKDPFGNIITTGYFMGFADFNPSAASNVLTSAGGKDIYLGKLNADGSYAWAFRFGGTGDDIGYKVISDNLGNVILCGQYMESMDADPGAGVAMLNATAGVPSGFIIKLDANGNYLWSANFASPSAGSSIICSAIDVDDNGNLVVAGSISVNGNSEVDFNPGAGVNSLNIYYRFFMLKLTSTGAFVWLKGLEGYAGYDATISDVVLDGASNVFISGTYASIIDFDPGAGVYSINGNGPTDAFIAKYTSTGDLSWLQYWYDPSYAITSNGMDIDNDGNIYMIGRFNYTMDFNPDLIGSFILTNNSYQGYIVKLDSDGLFIYAKPTSEGSTFSICQAITHDADNNVYYTGSFTGAADLNPNSGIQSATNTGGYNDFYVTKLDAAGGFVYSNPFGANYEETGRAIVYDAQSSSYTITGDFATTFDTDPDAVDVTNLTTGGFSDSYIIKYTELNCSPVLSEFNVTSCGNYDWNGQLYTDNGTYEQVLTAISGCDSIVTLHLTIASASSSNLNVTACVEYSFDGQELNEPGNYIGTFTNAQGCDSLVYLNLSIVPFPTLALSIDGNTINCASDATSFEWFNCQTNETIAGATSSSYSPTQSGSYGVNVNSGYCIESDCIDFTYIGVQENAQERLLIYPNPAADWIAISIPNGPYSSISIYSSDGRLVKSVCTYNSISQIDVSDLSNGLYEIAIQGNDNKTMRSKLTIQ